MKEYRDKNRQNFAGLTGQQVEQARRTHGENVLTPPKKTSMWLLYLEKYKDPIIQILIGAAVLSLGLAFVKGEFIETIGIFLAIFLATTVGFYFERDAARKFEVLTQMSEEQPVKVVRDGKVATVPRREIVVGDIVLLDVGDEVPADGELLESADLEIDESSLTGEPLAEKHADPKLADKEATYGSAQALRSTMVMSGTGTMRVEAVGDQTEIGRVARKATENNEVKTPLNMQLERLARMISKVGSGMAIAAFIIFLVHDILTQPVWHTGDWLGMAEVVLTYFMMAVTLIVMAVPEGLPMAVTLALALNMRRMLKSNNLVRKLHACETMGAVNVICTDKTGTLTQNRMTVAEMHITGDRELLCNAIATNSTANLDADGQPIGNPTEAALLRWVNGEGQNYEKLRWNGEILNRTPFSTERKMMTTEVKLADGSRWLFAKGAPEKILSLCQLDEKQRIETVERLKRYASKAMRTLAFCCWNLDTQPESEVGKSGATLQAVCGISDPIRSDVPAAVAQCQEAGVEVKVVTGDTAATAIEIARQIGIWDDNCPMESHISGTDWEALSDDEAYERAAKLRVMSRARPSDKQRLVKMLQRRGMVVAVTGDGTNDAPALNHAHVGLSLGSGTSVAKSASDITLIDDSFHSIGEAVMWGRSLYRNIQRFLFFQLVVNVAALLLVLGGAFIGTEMPLTITQILWVNLIMDTFAAMALASLPPSREVMKEKPRRQEEFILTPYIVKNIGFIGIIFFIAMFALLIYYERNDVVDVHELTIFFTTFVMLQWWNLFNARALMSSHSALHNIKGSGGFFLVQLAILIGQWLIVEFGGKMFRTVHLSLTEWLTIIALTSPVLIVGEVVRLIKRLRHETV